MSLKSRVRWNLQIAQKQPNCEHELRMLRAEIANACAEIKQARDLPSVLLSLRSVKAQLQSAAANGLIESDISIYQRFLLDEGVIVTDGKLSSSETISLVDGCFTEGWVPSSATLSVLVSRLSSNRCRTAKMLAMGSVNYNLIL